MTLLNLTVLGAHRPHIPCTVVQVKMGPTFSAPFSKIIAGAHPSLAVDEELSRSKSDKVYVGPTKDTLSIVDKQLIVDDVCAMFGQHTNFTVTVATRMPNLPRSTLSQSPSLHIPHMYCLSQNKGPR